MLKRWRTNSRRSLFCRTAGEVKPPGSTVTTLRLDVYPSSLAVRSSNCHRTAQLIWMQPSEDSGGASGHLQCCDGKSVRPPTCMVWECTSTMRCSSAKTLSLFTTLSQCQGDKTGDAYLHERMQTQCLLHSVRVFWQANTLLHIETNWILPSAC